MTFAHSGRPIRAITLHKGFGRMTIEWPVNAEELEALQCWLANRHRSELSWQPASDQPLLVGGVFVASGRGGEGAGDTGDPAWAAAVVLARGQVIDSAVVRGHFEAGYTPGLLALREGRLLAETVAALRQAPDVLLVNATGRDHPRRAGLALHLGAVLGMPTIGVTDRALVAEGPWPGPERGSCAELRLEGELVGFRVTICTNRRPVVVHAGWRVDAPTARDVVLGLGEVQRTPLPLREARRLARTARAES